MKEGFSASIIAELFSVSSSVESTKTWQLRHFDFGTSYC